MANPEHVERLVESEKDSWNKTESYALAIVSEILGESIGEKRKKSGHTTEEGLADFRGYDLRGFDLNNSDFRGSDLSGANLSGDSIYGLVLSKCKIQGANLTGSVFDGCNFNGADLSGADLSDAKFPKSSMQNANMSGAQLHGVEFARTDLTGARFDGCDLRSTSLIGANLACSMIHNSEKMYAPVAGNDVLDVVGTHFDGSRERFVTWVKEMCRRLGRRETPDNWILFSESSSMLMGMTVLWPVERVTSVEDLIDKDRSIRAYVEALLTGNAVRYYYRGQGCNTWPLAPSLHREGLDIAEAELVEELITSEPDEFTDSASAFDKLVLARHYSLPSRLLDVTKNLLVGLYFACRELDPCDHGKCDRTSRLDLFVTPTELIKSAGSDTVSVLAASSFLTSVERSVLLTLMPLAGCGPRIADDGSHGNHNRPSYDDVMLRLLHFIAREKPYFQSRIDPKDLFRVVVVEPRRMFPRLRAQASAYIYSVYHDRFETANVSELDANMPVYGQVRFDIPHESKEKILRQLDALNINEETMFPGLDAAARTIAARHKKYVAEDRVRIDGQRGGTKPVV